MENSIKPISVSASLSLALHAVLAVAILQTQQVMQAAGPGLEIELVSSIFVSEQDEAERAAANASAPVERANNAQTSPGSEADKPVEQFAAADESAVPDDTYEQAAQSESIDNDAGEQVSTRSTASSQQQTALVELLHSTISEHKRYPYLARRQRREGVATVGFVLHPDGSVQNARLLQSSRTSSLDKAALDAVRSIEPFTPAGDFIDRPEAYRVDVVFNFNVM